MFLNIIHFEIIQFIGVTMSEEKLRHDNEFDFIEFFSLLWNGKIKIIFVFPN